MKRWTNREFFKKFRRARQSEVEVFSLTTSESYTSDWRRFVGSIRRRGERRDVSVEMTQPMTSHDRHNFLSATMRIFLVVSPPGKLQVIYYTYMFVGVLLNVLFQVVRLTNFSNICSLFLLYILKFVCNRYLLNGNLYFHSSAMQYLPPNLILFYQCFVLL